MRRALRVFLPLLLCVIFLYNIMGYMVLYTSMRMILRQQNFAKLSRLPDSALTAITVFKTDRAPMHASKKMREIISGGKMYDVVRQKDHGTSITYLCLRDREEEKLIAKANIRSDSSTAPYPFSGTARRILDQIIKTALLSDEKCMGSSSGRELMFPGNSLPYTHPMLPVSAPPPQHFS